MTEQQPPVTAPHQEHQRPRVRIDRNELAGAFGDLGTDFPLIVGMILASGLNAGPVLTMFGLMQLITGFTYGLPMPVQPLKAMAVIVITQGLEPSILFGGGLVVAVVMLILTLSGLLRRLAEAIPLSVIRGIQFGLGLQLATLALTDFLPAEGPAGYALAALAFGITVLLLGNRRVPPALIVVALGVAFAVVLRADPGRILSSAGLTLPMPELPSAQDLWTGFLLLAIPQIPLSLGNSIFATEQLVKDLFPERPISINKIGLTYSLMNFINPIFGGVPTCHGSGGLAGHHAFGGRTGGSVVLEGSMYLSLGLFFAAGFEEVSLLFPKPMLAVILFFEALVLLRLIRDVATSGPRLAITLIVGLVAVSLPYGYLIGLVLGVTLDRLSDRGWIGLFKG